MVLSIEILKMYFPTMDESILSIVSNSISATTMGISNVANESRGCESFFDQCLRWSCTPSERFSNFMLEKVPDSLLHPPILMKVL